MAARKTTMVANPKKSRVTRRTTESILDEHGRHPNEVTREEGWKIVDDLARRFMSMSAEEFLRAWDAGEIHDPDRPEVIHVLMALPFAR
jgi:hypothetical protein